MSEPIQPRDYNDGGQRDTAPWLPGHEPQPGKLARARLRSQADIAIVERYQPRDLLPAATIFECFRSVAAGQLQKPAMIALQAADPAIAPRTLSYQDLIELLTRTANMFHALAGHEKPSAAVILPMIPEGLITLWAGATAGISTPVNPFLELHYVAAILNASKANILVTTDDAIWQKLKTIRDQVPTLKHVLMIDASDPELDFAKNAARYPADRLTFEPQGDFNSVCVHLPTGGTTGAPKLVKMTQSGQLTLGWTTGALMGPTPDGVVGHAMPNFHVGGTTSIAMRTILHGQTLLTLTPLGFRDPGIIRHFWDIARKYKMTSVLSTPSTAAALLADRNSSADGHCLTDYHCGGSTVPVALMHNFHDRFGLWLRENWGMTEIHGTITGHPNNGQQPVIGSVGYTLPFYRTKTVVVDDDNAFVRECAPGERGVLALGGPTVTPGYVDPKLDKDYIIQGMPDGARWGNSGDVGTIDEHGYIWLYGRAKEVIIRGGHNLDPKPVEEILVQHPSVQLAAMVGKPDIAKGELPVAYIQPKAGSSIDRDELLAFCASQIHERAALPVELIVIDEMPLTPIGKIAKPTLKIDILRRTADAVAATTLGADASFTTTVDTSGRRPKVTIAVKAGTADAVARLQAALAGFEFDSEVRAG